MFHFWITKPHSSDSTFRILSDLILAVVLVKSTNLTMLKSGVFNIYNFFVYFVFVCGCACAMVNVAVSWREWILSLPRCGSPRQLRLAGTSQFLYQPSRLTGPRRFFFCFCFLNLFVLSQIWPFCSHPSSDFLHGAKPYFISYLVGIHSVEANVYR